jgi:PPOX class probable F420-dependent enzyme
MSPQLDRAEAKLRLVAARFGVLATITPAGAPHAVPITFAVVDDLVVTAVDHKPKRSSRLQRVVNLERTPAASLLVHADDDDWDRLWWVRADLSGGPVTDRDLRDGAVAALADKYHQYRQHPPAGTVLGLRIERITAWTAER